MLCDYGRLGGARRRRVPGRDRPGGGPRRRSWPRGSSELIAAGEAGPGEIVVLLRYATAASIYEQALVARGVPVAPAPGGGFYAGQVVCDLAAYVRVLANPLDDEALYGVLASPLCGLRPTPSRRTRPGGQDARSTTVGGLDGGRCGRTGGGGRAGGTDAGGARATRGDPRAIDRSGGRRPGWGWPSCSSAAATGSGPWAGRGRPSGTPTCASCCAWRGTSRPAKGGTCGVRRPAGSWPARRRARAGRRARRRGRRAADDDPRGEGARVPGRLPRRPRARAADRGADDPDRRRAGRPAGPDAGLDARRHVGLRRAARRARSGGPGRRAADRLRGDDPGAGAADPQRRRPLRPAGRRRGPRRRSPGSRRRSSAIWPTGWPGRPGSWRSSSAARGSG